MIYAKYTNPPVGAFVLDERTPLNANALSIFLIVLLILLNYIAVKIDKIDKPSPLLASRLPAHPAETLGSCTKAIRQSYLEQASIANQASEVTV